MRPFSRGAGQGSLYHHFAGKADLAATAVRAVEAEMRADADTVLRADTSPLERVRDYLRTGHLATARRPTLCAHRTTSRYFVGLLPIALELEETH